MTSIWHIGFAVSDLEQGTKEFGEVFGLRWRPVL
jgi:extradiol dioxygenase family protein